MVSDNRQKSSLKTAYDGSSALDSYSTSQTSHFQHQNHDGLTCANHAPFMVYPVDRPAGRIWYIAQGCCNSWNCPRCGEIRAKQEYWRIVNGAESLSERRFEIYMIVATCKGKKMPLKRAESDYGLWTNRFNTAIRTFAKRNGLNYHFAAVTERQKRGHPHTHYVTTFCPPDAVPYSPISWQRDNNGRLTLEHTQPSLYSAWLVARLDSAGFGTQFYLGGAGSVGGVARYVSKYLFKSLREDRWPENWKRVRYSHSWPKEDRESNPEAFAIVQEADWQRAAKLDSVIVADTFMTYEMARHRITNVTFKGER